MHNQTIYQDLCHRYPQVNFEATILLFTIDSAEGTHILPYQYQARYSTKEIIILYAEEYPLFSVVLP